MAYRQPGLVCRLSLFRLRAVRLASVGVLPSVRMPSAIYPSQEGRAASKGASTMGRLPLAGHGKAVVSRRVLGSPGGSGRGSEQEAVPSGPPFFFWSTR